MDMKKPHLKISERVRHRAETAEFRRQFRESEESLACLTLALAEMEDRDKEIKKHKAELEAYVAETERMKQWLDEYDSKAAERMNQLSSIFSNAYH